ncbi:amidohydrolase [Nocardioides sp. LHG3406-4]|uniref:amidohydrolase n=1 Tax=Nocardioides sp. LHG3406-4 TaxID=2804575 RepID=UPI003CFA3C2C
MYFNGVIATFDGVQRTARALVVEGESIVAVGSEEHCREIAGRDAQRIDLDGGFVYPGFTDCHTHLANAAREATMVDLRTSRSYEEALAEIRRFSADRPEGQWILGGRWAHNRWTTPHWPHRRELDIATGGRPAALSTLDGHSIWVNTAALALLGIDADTPDPVGGEIVRDEDGTPTGVLKETAIERARSLWSTHHDVDLRACLPLAIERALAGGLTSVHDFDGVDAIEAFGDLRDAGQLPLRVFKSVPVPYLRTAITDGWRTGGGDHWLRQGPVKIFADGALGSRTAWMKAGYLDEPGNHGLTRTPVDDMDELIRLAAEHGIASAVHAIGDEANSSVLALLARHPTDDRGQRLRHRIEHAQHLDHAALTSFAPLGVIASMQPTHCTDDMHMVEDAVPAASLSYPWRSLIDTGATVAFGSDAPIGALEPLQGIHAAVSRQDTEGRPADGFQPEQRITVTEAIHAYTAAAAYASGEEQVKGRLAVGQLADFVVLSDDLLRADPSLIPKLQVHRTVVGGQTRWTS